MAKSSKHRARILIVDDETAQMNALCNTLAENGYETIGCDGGDAALAALLESKFDLLLADLAMPGMDGITLLQKALEIQPDLVGIIMTGEGSIASAVEAMKVGALDYILKPFKLSAILPVLNRGLTIRRLRIQNAELERRLRERAAELEAANRELEAFSYTVSHDLRSPLASIHYYTQLIEEQVGDKLDELGRRLFNVVRSSSRRMGLLVDDLLAFSKLGRQPISAAHVDMTALAAEAWTELRAGAPGTAPEFRLQTLPAAWGDYALLKQVWTNLLSNALKYSAKTERALVEVTSQQADGEATYCVSDNGAGFDMQQYERLFAVFQRLHSESEFGGTGVGLAIVQRLVTRHGGRVWAQGRVGEGARFYFSLPVHESAAAHRGERTDRELHSPADANAAEAKLTDV